MAENNSSNINMNTSLFIEHEKTTNIANSTSPTSATATSNPQSPSSNTARSPPPTLVENLKNTNTS